MKYYTVKCNIESDDLTEENYGLMIQQDDGSREYVLDISCHMDDVNSLVDKMNKYQICQCQAKEIIEDFKFNKI